jgi:pyridoxamine 5'-phosphate oxidase
MTEDEVGDDPLVAARAWFDEAVAMGVDEPGAMQLATVDPTGQPFVRSVLCRGIDERGFRFFTNLGSAKGEHLRAEPRCGLVLFWHRPLLRQVLARGRAVPLDRDEVAGYGATRSRASRIGAWASRQSQPIADRAALESEVARFTTQFEGMEVPLPPSWGGYVVRPTEVELWQGHDARLHDRLRWRRTGVSAWTRERLAP